MVGLTLIAKTENLFILIPYVIIMFINAVYLVAKAMKIRITKVIKRSTD